MTIRDINETELVEFNKLVSHPLQSYEWGEFRQKTGVKVIRKGFYADNKLTACFQMTIHRIPRTNFTIGYIPKGNMPTKELLLSLIEIGRKNKCIFIQLEPNIKEGSNFIFELGRKENIKVIPSAHPLFTKYTLQLDLTKTDEELLKQMHPKTRYNIRIAQKHGVSVKEEFSDEAFNEYLKLTAETTSRQGFFAHNENYHRLMWKILGSNNQKKPDVDKLSAHLLIAYYNQIPLTTWVLFVFHSTLYYPYGASSSKHRKTMSSNLMMWEAIKYGKKLGLKTFDMWGSLGENPDPNDAWYGFHKFKTGFGPKLIEFAGSYDLVINPTLYQFYKIADKLRWLVLRLKR